MVRVLLTSCIWLFASFAHGQTELLPRGIGIFQLGQRQYGALDSYFDDSGNKQPLGNKLSRDLSGSQLGGGGSGSDLKRLVSELGRYEDDNGRSLASDLDLGRVEGDIDVNVKTQIFGFAYGITSRWTGFFGIPYIDSTVDAKLSHVGTNNADAIRQQLGDLAYDELDNGLVQASQINTATLYNQIAANGYQSIDHWQHKGFGDLRVGAKTAFRQPTPKHVKAGATITSTLLVPTGYVEQPDVLTDISFGTGYYSLALGAEEAVTFRKQLQVGVAASGQYNFPTEKSMRVPEDRETMTGPDRQTNVDVRPGHDYSASTYGGWDFGLVDLRYRQGFERHLQDKFSGNLKGNYQTLSNGTAVWKHYHEASIRIDTVESFQRNRFVYPMHVALNHRQLIKGVNATNETYYELQLNAFFSAR